jgi:hypothetical protein
MFLKWFIAVIVQFFVWLAKKYIENAVKKFILIFSNGTGYSRYENKDTGMFLIDSTGFDTFHRFLTNCKWKQRLLTNVTGRIDTVFKKITEQ